MDCPQFLLESGIPRDCPVALEVSHPSSVTAFVVDGTTRVDGDLEYADETTVGVRVGESVLFYPWIRVEQFALSADATAALLGD